MKDFVSAKSGASKLKGVQDEKQTPGETFRENVQSAMKCRLDRLYIEIDKSTRHRC